MTKTTRKVIIYVALATAVIGAVTISHLMRRRRYDHVQVDVMIRKVEAGRAPFSDIVRYHQQGNVDGEYGYHFYGEVLGLLLCQPELVENLPIDHLRSDPIRHALFGGEACRGMLGHPPLDEDQKLLLADLQATFSQRTGLPQPPVESYAPLPPPNSKNP